MSYFDYPYWKTWLWRLVRGAMATAFAQTTVYICGDSLEKVGLTQCITNGIRLWTEPKQALIMVTASLISGFFLALGMAIREYCSKGDKNSKWNKLPI